MHNVTVNDEMITIARELAEITRLVEADDFGSTLNRFVARVVRAIPGCDDAILTVRSNGAMEVVAGADPGFDPIAPGPIVEAATFGEPRRLDDVGADKRWPSFSTHLANAGYQSCLALPLNTQSDDTAVLTLFSAKPGEFTDTAYDIVLLLTLHAGTLFDNASLYHDSSQLVAQLRIALHTRSLVGRAQGMLMRQFNIDSDSAFDTLKRSSQNSNTKIRDLAAMLVNAHDSGQFEAALTRLTRSAATVDLGDKQQD